VHPILADWRRFGAYLSAWALVGALIAAQLVIAAPFAWVEALAFAVPLSLLFGFVGLGAFWVCQAAPLHLSRLVRSLGTQLVTAIISAALWFAAGRGWANALDRLARIDTEGGEPKAVLLQDGTRLPLSRSGYGRLKGML